VKYYGTSYDYVLGNPVGDESDLGYGLTIYMCESYLYWTSELYSGLYTLTLHDSHYSRN
jgi:hypothetical protein